MLGQQSVLARERAQIHVVKTKPIGKRGECGAEILRALDGGDVRESQGRIENRLTDPPRETPFGFDETAARIDGSIAPESASATDSSSSMLLSASSTGRLTRKRASVSPNAPALDDAQ